MKTRPTGKRKKASNRMSQVADGVISPRSRKKRRRLGALKGWMKIKGDIIHSDMEDDWDVQ